MDIIIEQPTAKTLNLSADEQALMDEINIAPKPAARRRPVARRPPPPQMQEEIDAFTNPLKRNTSSQGAQHQMFGEPEEEEEEYEEEPDQGPQGYAQQEPQGPQGYAQPAEEQPSAGYTSIDDEKADLLNKLARLEKKGLNVNKRLNAYSDISEIRTEYKRLLYGIEAEQSIKFQRMMLLTCVNGIEMLNKTYNPFDLYLDGWGDYIMTNIDTYDGVFEELYTKYRTKMHVAPEIKLMMMLGGSGMMFHISRSFAKAATTNVNEVMKQNPGLAQNIIEAVKNTKPRSEEPPRVDATGRREMRGPGMDLSSLMGGIMMPPPPQSTRGNNQFIEVPTAPAQPPVVDDDDNMSDIVSLSGSYSGDLREVRVAAARPRGRGKPKGKTISFD
jgi:hypothetical protein